MQLLIDTAREKLNGLQNQSVLDGASLNMISCKCWQDTNPIPSSCKQLIYLLSEDGCRFYFTGNLDESK